MGRRKVARFVVALAAGAVLAAGALSGCTPAAVDTAGATIIDVRTPAEYQAGHLKGAINIDVQSADFATKIAALPKDKPYVLYCRSGVRAGNAQAQMKAAGFTNVTNAGGMVQASQSTGLPIVTT